MESVSTLNLGASAARAGAVHKQKTELKGLASQMERLKGQSSPEKERSELMEVARKFEAILIHQMLKAMRKTVNKSELFNSFSLEQYESMLDEELANEMAANRGIGLADTLFYQLSRLQGDEESSSTVIKPYGKVPDYE